MYNQIYLVVFFYLLLARVVFLLLAIGSLQEEEEEESRVKWRFYVETHMVCVQCLTFSFTKILVLKSEFPFFPQILLHFIFESHLLYEQVFFSCILLPICACYNCLNELCLFYQFLTVTKFFTFNLAFMSLSRFKCAIKGKSIS